MFCPFKLSLTSIEFNPRCGLKQSLKSWQMANRAVLQSLGTDKTFGAGFGEQRLVLIGM
ncbi:hypothetical protein AVDCRST_MAG92-2571 [uncultured Coleofasciculus sp.]|uniref:Uncharacterized protein n=1 Tax=uncultured Coleofasciculus sp. TaxID=1267456 RepID=A0A6J4IYX0_9CYAN|nr:hypothetical protein AVDCRST_MAG92-2571 [uncultured Coleofasciculus sp.]